MDSTNGRQEKCQQTKTWQGEDGLSFMMSGKKVKTKIKSIKTVQLLLGLIECEYWVSDLKQF